MLSSHAQQASQPHAFTVRWDSKARCVWFCDALFAVDKEGCESRSRSKFPGKTSLDADLVAIALEHDFTFSVSAYLVSLFLEMSSVKFRSALAKSSFEVASGFGFV